MPATASPNSAPDAERRSTGSRIHVGPLALLEELVETSGARYLVTAINKQMIPPTPRTIQPDRHLRLGFNDIVVPTSGMTPPAAHHVLALIQFAKEWNHDGPLVIHCLAGISRSTASAFIVLCTLNPGCPEDHIAARLRDASETAEPNARLVRLADQLLARDGRMVRAVENMRASQLWSDSAIPFSLPSIISPDNIDIP